MNLRFTSRRKLTAFALLIGAGLTVFFFATSENSRGVEWLSAPPHKSRLALLGQWMGPVEARLAWVKQWFAGKPSTVTVTITAGIFEFDPSLLSAHGLPGTAGFTNSFGARAFFLDDDESFLKELIAAPGVNTLGRPRITLLVGTQGQLASYESFLTNRIGWWLDVWPRVNARGMDLTCFFTGTARRIGYAAPVDGETNRVSIITNAAFGARLNVPRDKSVLLLGPGTNANHRTIGILLAPTLKKPQERQPTRGYYHHR